MSATFKKRHKLILQVAALLAMLILPIFLYFSTEAHLWRLVRSLLAALAFVMLFASWVSTDRKKPESSKDKKKPQVNAD